MTLTRNSATFLLAEMAAGRLSAADLMAATLERIAAANPRVNAIVALADGDALMAAARAADEARRAGAARGALHGLPIAVKDLVNTAGIRSTMGSPIFADTVPERDDIAAARLRAAGAILIGKTNVPEFGLGSHTFNPVYGATGNAYDPGRSAGGSSGGAAVALATGMLALADGSDMMGSLRNPAAWNNVYGFRPSWGRVPGEPVGDSFLHSLATLGPMAREPADLAILLDVMSGPDPRLPHGVPAAPVAPLVPADLRGQRIGWLGDWGGAYPMERGILEQAGKAVAVLADLGAEVEDLPPPFDAEALWQSWTTLRSFAVAGSLSPLMAQRDRLRDVAIWEIERGQALSAMAVHRASVARSDWFRAAAALFDRYDALVLPATQVWPFDVTLDWPKEIAGRSMDSYHRWMEVVVPVSLLGAPAVALPAGFGPQGLPAGVQVFARRGADAALLALAAAYHEATRWPERHPAA